MSARDASTLRQVSLAALLGYDARALLSTDDPATHLVYRRVIEQARVWSIERALMEAKNHAIEIGNMLVELLPKKKA